MTTKARSAKIEILEAFAWEQRSYRLGLMNAYWEHRA